MKPTSSNLGLPQLVRLCLLCAATQVIRATVAHLSTSALLVQAFEVLLEAAECGVSLVHALVEAGKLMQHDVLVVPTRHRSSVALCGCVIASQVLVFVACANCHLRRSHLTTWSNCASRRTK